MTKNLLSQILILSFITISHTSLADKSYDKTNLLTCSAYHFKEKLNSQYSAEKKYNYHNKYFNNLKFVKTTNLLKLILMKKKG